MKDIKEELFVQDKIVRNSLKRFISFTGIDGSGKSTVSKALVDELNKEGIDAVWLPYLIRIV